MSQASESGVHINYAIYGKCLPLDRIISNAAVIHNTIDEVEHFGTDLGPINHPCEVWSPISIQWRVEVPIGRVVNEDVSCFDLYIGREVLRVEPVA